ncbi:MAG: hypothetical protein AAB633_02220 [Patescibacteria group bacterium]
MKMTIAEFCLALHRVCLRGDRDEQGADGETLWSSLEAVERKRGKELVKPPTTIEETVVLAEDLGVNAQVLGGRLTRMPDWHRVLNDWQVYRNEWWGLPR